MKTLRNGSSTCAAVWRCGECSSLQEGAAPAATGMETAPTERRTPRKRALCRRAFTLVELLTVIAVLGILAAILVPVVGRAQESARRARVKTQFAQWTVAIEGFRAEYGYYPNFATGTAAPLPAACRVNEVPGLFVQTLTGRRADGAAPDLARALAANPRRVAFLNFAADELGAGANPPVCDAFGNTDIVVLVDRDGDGLIVAPNPLPTVTAAETGRTLTPDAAAFPAGGVRAGVVFYSAGAGRNAEDIVCSWR